MILHFFNIRAQDGAILSFRKLKGLVLTIHVTNDLAERGIKTLQDYKEILTEDTKHREIILHCVEKDRQERPDFQQSTLAIYRQHDNFWGAALYHF